VGGPVNREIRFGGKQTPFYQAIKLHYAYHNKDSTLNDFKKGKGKVALGGVLVEELLKRRTPDSCKGDGKQRCLCNAGENRGTYREKVLLHGAFVRTTDWGGVGGGVGRPTPEIDPTCKGKTRPRTRFF